MKLTKDQLFAIDWLKKTPKGLVAFDMGTGKSAIAAKSIQPGERVLIICPATLKINWQREIKLWSGLDSVIIKKKSETLPKTGIVIINYDILGRKEKKKVVSNFDFSNFDRVIVDESQMAKNPKAIRTKITAKIIMKTQRVVLLSGTPLARPIDLYVVLYAIGAIKMPYGEFGMRYCDPKKIYIRNREVWTYRGLTNEVELKSILDPYMIRAYKKLEATKEVKVISLDLPLSRQEKEYSFNDIVKDPRPIGFEGLAELLHDQALLKLPLAIRHIKMRLEQYDKVVLIAKHHDVIDKLVETFDAVKLDGRDSLEQKQKAVDEFQNNPDCKVFVGQITAAGVGITLTASNYMCVVEPSWSYSELAQVSDRIFRIGQTKDVLIELLTIHKSIDERVLYTTLEKKHFTKTLIGLAE